MKHKFESPIFILLVAGLGCFLLSLIGMGLAPWYSLSYVTKPVSSEGNPYYEKNGELSSIGRGRKIYIREA